MATSPSTAAATSSATSPGDLSSSSTAPAAASSTASSPPFVFGTSPSLINGSSPVAGTQFAPLFTTAVPPAPPSPAPRNPIFLDHITNHIKFLLNPADHNYHKWKTFVLMVLVRYGVSYLVEHPPPPNASATYLELDAHVVLWIYATLSDTMCDHVVGATTTFALWNKIRDYFLANRAARFMILNRKYRNLKQGDLSVSEYARRMKLLTDALADIDRAVTEVDLTTQFLHGLDKRLDTIRVVLGDQDLPFDTVLSRVVLAEESQEHRAAKESTSAFALPSGGASGSGSSTGGRTPPDRADRAPAGAPVAPPQPLLHSRTRTLAVAVVTAVAVVVVVAAVVDVATTLDAATPLLSWRRPSPAYPLLPAPPAPPAPFYQHPPSSWEYAAMLNATYSNGGFPSAPAPEWYFDSGASSHVTGNQAPATQSTPAPDPLACTRSLGSAAPAYLVLAPRPTIPASPPIAHPCTRMPPTTCRPHLHSPHRRANPLIIHLASCGPIPTNHPRRIHLALRACRP
ncbi:uncharacterized protein [Aegilops tauschii subsp. strangulata]